MDPDPTDSSRLSIYVISVAFLFLASMFFALTETAISSVSRNRIRVLADRGDSRAKKVLYVLDHFDDAITTLLIFTNIAHMVAAALVTVFVTDLYKGDAAILGIAITVSTFAMTLLMFFLGEMLPKSIGKKTAEKSSLATSGLLVVLMKIAWPFTKVLTAIGNGVAKNMKTDEEATVTEDELYDIIEDMEEEGSIDEEQSELISSALQFGDVTVSSILTPRVDVAAVNANDAPEEILEFIKNQTHSRILVYEKTVDNCVGVLRIRRYLKEYLETKKLPDVRALMDPVYFAPQTMQIDELLTEMSKKKLNMAVVTDSYGGTLGVVTVEDILEEIVGEIWDEDDEIKEPIAKLTDTCFRAEGEETVLDLFDFMEFEDPEEAENEERFTNLLIADWVFEEFGAIPEKGASFRYHNLKISVEEIVHNRILSVLCEILPVEEEEVTE